MTRKITCFYRVFGLNNAGPGLKHSGIGNCKTCTCSEENKKCRNYLEIVIDEEDCYFGEIKE